MSITRTRTRGDDYPIKITFSVNNEPVDLTGSIVKFSYKNENEAVRTITGSNTATTGEAEFIPESGVDFQVDGVFTYDVQRVSGGYTYTHEKGILILDGDVTP
jgi:hypothetical protein